jgi:amidase
MILRASGRRGGYWNRVAGRTVPGMDLDIATATATELAQAIGEREVSSREVLEYLLARGERLNPALNAIVAWDVDRARAAAAAADEATARGEAGGPLHGLPITVKDVFETEGLVTTSGAPELAGYVPERDAVAVARLKAAGAIVFGKTNTPLYAGDFQTYNEVYGRTSNPWDLSRGAGGSSGGAGAALAAGLTPLELGSDIGGSIRNPAHYNGVYGHKPSWGIVPTRGHIPGPPGSLVPVDIGVAGPLARGVADLRTALGIVAGPLPQEAAGWRLELDPGEYLDGVRGLRVATVFDEGADLLPVAADVRANLDSFAARAADAGARVEAVPLPVPLADGLKSWLDLAGPVFGLGLPDEEFARLAALENVDGDTLGLVMAKAMTSRFRPWFIAAEVRERQRAAWAAFFADYDVVLAPVMPTAAFAHDTERPAEDRVVEIDGAPVPYLMTTAWCCAIGSALLPVVTLPTGLSRAGLPVGVQVIGPFLSDLRLLRIAELLDATAGDGFIPPPLA